MDEQRKISAVASSSNSASMVSSKKYDVFLSFRGEDTRRNFTSHLYKALNEEKVKTYIDNQIEKGDEISPTLINAIEDSRISIVIFSENYASSKWCLGELSKILECQNEKGLIVMPVFYNIDPSHVRRQTGRYKQAFAKHDGESRCKEWKAALTEAANLAGWDSRTYRNDPELLKDIVGDVLRKLPPRYPNQHKGLVGIEENFKQIESLLKIGSCEVRTLGIWGMGGIGKTTLAAYLYDKLSHKFEGCCFLTNVREISVKPQDLCDNSEISRLRGKKVLIVLDDMATSEQLEKLMIYYDFWEPGSRVIVTTRNKQILSLVDEIYQVQDLSSHHSLQLLCRTVFGERQPKDGYEVLLRRVISYCQGIPLAIKVLGASLRKRSKEAWESELRKLKEIPKMEIHDVLKLSYDGLDPFEKNIFLDIACFFKGEKIDWVTCLLEAFGFYPAFGIEVLSDRALITISCDNRIEMHDLIQEMGRTIVDQESKDPGRRSRLWRPKDVHDVLKYNRGTDVVEGIFLDLHTLPGDLYLSSDSLAKMTYLRFLKIHTVLWQSIYLPNGLKLLSDNMRFLYWEGFCLESLPSSFCAEQLVELHMSCSKLKKLWDGVQNLVNLKRIELDNSRDLIEIPDLSKAEKLERVSLCYCVSLRQLHPSMLSLPELTYLFLRGCTEIESLNVYSKSLSELDLNGCSSLKEISVISKEITELDLSHTAIHSLSSSMLSLPKLTNLYLSGCREIKSLNVHSKYLRILRLNGCSSLKEFSMTSEEITELDLSHTAICSLSSAISLPKLTNLCLSGCREIESLNLHSKSVRLLSLEGCSSLKEILVTSEEMTHLDLSNTIICGLPSSILSLPKLTHLTLSGCREIESLNVHLKSLHKLCLDGCSSLKEFSLSLTSEEMTELNLSCTAICALPSSIGHLLSLKMLDLSGSNVESLPANIKDLSMLTRLWLNNCWKLVSLPELPPFLRELHLDDCGKLVSLPVLPPSLEKVSACNCTFLETEISQRLVLQHMLQSRIPYLHEHHTSVLNRDCFIFPGDHVTDERGFLTAGSSIKIPYLPISYLCGFICCIILPKSWYREGNLWCSVYYSTGVAKKEMYIASRKPVSDHVLFWYHDLSDLDRISEVFDRLSYIKFRFQFTPNEGRTEERGIKGCGVFLVYGTASRLKLVGSKELSGLRRWRINNE